MKNKFYFLSFTISPVFLMPILISCENQEYKDFENYFLELLNAPQEYEDPNFSGSEYEKKFGMFRMTAKELYDNRNTGWVVDLPWLGFDLERDLERNQLLDELNKKHSNYKYDQRIEYTVSWDLTKNSYYDSDLGALFNIVYRISWKWNNDSGGYLLKNSVSRMLNIYGLKK